MKFLKDILNEIKDIKTDSRFIRKFGILVGGIFTTLALFWLIWRADFIIWLWFLGVAFILLGLTLPIVLKPVYYVWMVASVVIGAIVSRFILILLFYIILTPVGLVLKIFGKDIISRKVDNDMKTYWIDRTEADRSNPEKMF